MLMTTYGSPRRNQIHFQVPAEMAIRKAIDAVEVMDAHLLLTDATVLLGQAKEKVADFVDLHIKPEA